MSVQYLTDPLTKEEVLHTLNSIYYTLSREQLIEVIMQLAPAMALTNLADNFSDQQFTTATVRIIQLALEATQQPNLATADYALTH